MFRSTIQKILFLLGVSGLFFSGICSGTATVPNASFNTFVAATDSFVGWAFTKDITGGTKYTVTQEIDSAHSAPGALKMQIKTLTDTTFTVGISTTITGLPVKKIFTITAWVKYADMPQYWNAMFYVQQATQLPPSYTWIDRKWGTLWGNNIGSSDWTQVTMSDTVKDSANILRLGITLWKSGTLWVDDIAVTYTAIPQATNYTVSPAEKEMIRNNRIAFSRKIPYSFEACSIDGKAIMSQSGIASALDLNRFDLKNGVYLVRVKTMEKTYSSKVMMSR